MLFLSLKSHCLFFADSDEFGIFLSIYSAKFEMCSFGQFFFYAGMSISNIQQIIFSSLSLNIVCKNIINNILFNKVWLSILIFYMNLGNLYSVSWNIYLHASLLLQFKKFCSDRSTDYWSKLCICKCSKLIRLWFFFL